MGSWLKRLVEVVDGANQVSSQPIAWTPERWEAVAAVSKEANAGVRALLAVAPSTVCRSDVRQVLSAEGKIAGFVAAMIWGFGPVSYGPHRVHKMLTAQRGDDASLTVIDRIMTVAASSGAAEGFGDLWLSGRSQVHGLGTAFGTKALYFAASTGRSGFCAHRFDRPGRA